MSIEKNDMHNQKLLEITRIKLILYIKYFPIRRLKVLSLFVQNAFFFLIKLYYCIHLIYYAFTMTCFFNVTNALFIYNNIKHVRQTTNNFCK